jgi:hypothetical protein
MNLYRHDLFIHLWKDRSTSEGLITHPLLSFAQNLSFAEAETAKFKWEFKVTAIFVFEYISQVLSWTRLTMLPDADGKGFNANKYWLNNVLVFDVLEENWSAETVVGFNGQSFVDTLATPLSAPPDSLEYKTAYKLVWRMLSDATMQKITHAKGLTVQPAAGALWDLKENEGKDCTEGTFAELLRYGTTHFRQTREGIRYWKAKGPTELLNKTLLEP